MSKTKAPSEAEIRDAAIIEGAAYFTAFCLRGRERIKVDAIPTRQEAEAAAQVLADHLGKTVMVYAVNVAGRQAHVVNINPKRAAALVGAAG